MRYFKPGDIVICVKSYCEFKRDDKRIIIAGHHSSRYGNTKEEQECVVPYTKEDTVGHIGNHPLIREVFKLFERKNTKPDWL